MNYLAHILLANHSDQAMLGALLGDFVKADDFSHYPEAIQLEIQLHRKVDIFTDQHEIIRAAKERFPRAHKRFAGILLDVFYDYALAQNWTAYSSVPLDEFIQNFYSVLHQYQTILPPKLSAIVPFITQQDWLSSYQTFSGVEIAIHRIARRLSRNGHLLVNGLPLLADHHKFFLHGFDQFFPQLVQFAEEQRSVMS